MLCVLLAGAMTDLYGPDRPRASHSAQPVVRRAATTPDTSPPILSAWSGPPVPQCCLANRSPVRKSSERLQAALESALADRLHGLGSTIYQIAWKPHVTPSGRQISRQRASARRTSDSAHSSGLSAWPTPTTRDWKDGGNPDVNVELNGLLGRVVWLAGWAQPDPGSLTPTGSEYAGTTNAETATEGSATVTPEARQTDGIGTFTTAGWPTPTVGNASGSQMAKDASATGRRPDGSKATVSLPQVASFAGWPTPRASENVQTNLDEIAETGSSWLGQNRGATVSTMAQMAKGCPARFTASGQMLTGCSAGMESGGQLNPEHSRWLMGYPAVWGSCGATAMQSIRTRRRSSSPRSTPP